MAEIIMFFPWEKEKCGDLTYERWLWASSYKGKEIKPVFWNGDEQQILKSLLTGTIYIRGHGHPESEKISRKRSASDDDLPAIALVLRLRTSGLSKDFAGKIKVYSCHSAITFGKKFATLMRDAGGYTKCSYYGYTMTVNAAYEAKTFSGKFGFHKTAISDYKDFTMGSPNYGKFPTYRASEVRIQL